MSKIKNILICGLGAIGGYYASKVALSGEFNLKILVDEKRLDQYKKTPRIINNVSFDFDYILPENIAFKADLIIISTKSGGLNDAIINIKNFVYDKTVILSFLNGVTSENKIAEVYGYDKILYSFLLGHTFFRKNNEITHDGKAKIVFGSTDKTDEKLNRVEEVFNIIDVLHEKSDSIIDLLWQKFAFNCCVNQISAITRLTFGEMKTNQNCLDLMKHICEEITNVAKNLEGITDFDFYKHTLEYLDLMIPEGKTSMLQDMEAGVYPEIDIFGGAVCSLGKKFGIKTPVNKTIADLIEITTANTHL